MMKRDNNPLIFYRTLLPAKTGSFKTELNDCLEMIAAIARETNSSLFRITAFNVADSIPDRRMNQELFESALLHFFPGQCPAFTLTFQEPETPWKVSLEAGFIKNSSATIHYRRKDQFPYVVIEWPEYRELWASGLQSRTPQESYQQGVENAFELVSSILKDEGMGFNNIVRQWNYVGNILQFSPVDQASLQNYQIFNEVRHIFYQQYRTVKGFPAATGIGNASDHVTIEICAIQSKNGLLEYAIDNPKQTNAYAYGQQVLVGQPLQRSHVKHAPEFERAKLVLTPQAARLYISGTAAIIGQETVGIGDIEKQTLCTIENINALTAPDHLKDCCPPLPNGKFEMSYLRIYIKEKQFMDQVKRICYDKYPGVPQVFVITDVCRDNLLMEIEGEMFFNPESTAN